MKKETSYIIMLVLVAAILVLMYSSGPKLTGYVVFEQTGNESFFGEGNYFSYENITWNGTAMVLGVNETTGNYISKIFNANETGELGENDSIMWNNLTWVGSDELIFEIKNCGSADCVNVSFEDANLNELNLSEQYFQYKIFFDGNTSNETIFLESINIADPLLAVEEQEEETLVVTINEPSGTKNVNSGIPVQFDITGAENLTLSCWYSLKFVTGDTIVIANDTGVLTDCSGSNFDVYDEGDYVLTLYVNNSEELFSGESSFSISLPVDNTDDTSDDTSDTDNEDDSDSDSSSGDSSTQVIVIPAFKLESESISGVSLGSGESQDFVWSTNNIGREAVSACSVKSLGDYASWVSASEDVLNINSGEVGVFAFNVLVPEETVEGSYLLSVSVECAETDSVKDFNVEVSISERDGGDQRAPVGGFTIFEGVGAGEIVIFVVVLLVLVFVFIFARRMRKSGKTLRDIINDIKLRLKIKQ